jgi:Tol biopolymer transport system component
MNFTQSSTVLALAFLNVLFFENTPLVQTDSGSIAYIRGGTEIRVIDPDGENDRRLWTHPDASFDLGLYDLAWRPDGKELAFSSAHASAYSLYHADLYSIKRDGSGVRKLTNPPARDEFKNYPKGSVTVTVRNNQYTFQQAQASSGVFTIYIAGAEQPQQITLTPGSSKTLVFKSVADFGKKAQAIVAIWGNYRWFMPGTDVQAGQTVKMPEFLISGDGVELFGAFRPVWRTDGSQLSFRNGHCNVNIIPADPPIGELYHKSMFAGKHPLGACTWDWGPIPALADQIIYTENAGETSAIFQTKEGGTHPGIKLTDFINIQYQLLHDLHWLPDGSGLLYSNTSLMADAANIFKYDFKTKQVVQVTQLENEFARAFSVSPDGSSLVYERAKTVEDEKNVELWIINLNGTGNRLLVRNGRNPSWRK